MFKGMYPGASSFTVTLYGSLAATGKGHMTDVALIEALKDEQSPRVDIIWKPDVFLPQHPNGMNFQAFDSEGHQMGEKTLFSWDGATSTTPISGNTSPSTRIPTSGTSSTTAGW